MKKARFTYLIIWVLMCIFYVSFERYLSYFTLLITSILPIISFLIMRIGSKKVCVDFHFEQKECTIGTNNQMIFHYHTSFFLPQAKVRIKLNVHNQFHSETTTDFIQFIIFAKDIQERFTIHSEKCGVVDYSMSEIVLIDFLGLFKKKIKCEHSHSFTVFPEPIQAKNVAQIIENGKERAKDTSKVHGNDFSDTYEIREYREGDSLHRLHHKLSYKLQKPMIREFESLAQSTMSVYVELFGTPEEIERSIAQYYGIALLLLKEQLTYEVQWQQKDNVYRVRIQTTEELYHNVKLMLATPCVGQLNHEPLNEITHQYYVINAKGIRKADKMEEE